MSTSTETALCASCSGTGWTRRPDNRVERCECWRRAQQTYADNLPLEFRLATIANYRALAGNEAALAAATKFLDGDRDLYLVGPVGSGKTRLAATLLNEAHRAGVRGFFARVPMLLLQLQPQATDEARESAAQLFARLCTTPLLVLDDVGAERDGASDFTRRTLLTVYEDRGDHGRRTIWTSNLRLDPDPRQASNPYRAKTLGEFMGDDRLASRIAGRAHVVALTTPDQRLHRRVREDR